MTTREANIRFPVDLTNTGQFFACCGLLELADRLWPGAEGWFDSPDAFVLFSHRDNSLESILSQAVACEFESLLPAKELAELRQLNERKSEMKSKRKSLSNDAEKRRKALNSKRIAAGFQLMSPFNLRVDWWLSKNCNADHLKTWAGPQAVSETVEDMKRSLKVTDGETLLELERRIERKGGGKSRAPLSFDSGRVGTAQDIGYSADNVEQAIACCVWTEFLAIIALQRFSLQARREWFL